MFLKDFQPLKNSWRKGRQVEMVMRCDVPLLLYCYDATPFALYIHRQNASVQRLFAGYAPLCIAAACCTE